MRDRDRETEYVYMYMINSTMAIGAEREIQNVPDECLGSEIAQTFAKIEDRYRDAPASW